MSTSAPTLIYNLWSYRSISRTMKIMLYKNHRVININANIISVPYFCQSQFLSTSWKLSSSVFVQVVQFFLCNLYKPKFFLWMMRDLLISDMDDFCGCLGSVNNVFWMAVCWGGVCNRGGGNRTCRHDGLWVSRSGGWRGTMSSYST